MMNCDCKVVATVHGSSLKMISKQKPVLRKMVLEKNGLERYVILNNRGKVGNIGEIYDSGGCRLYRWEVECFWACRDG